MRERDEFAIKIKKIQSIADSLNQEGFISDETFNRINEAAQSFFESNGDIKNKQSDVIKRKEIRHFNDLVKLVKSVLTKYDADFEGIYALLDSNDARELIAARAKVNFTDGAEQVEEVYRYLRKLDEIKKELIAEGKIEEDFTVKLEGLSKRQEEHAKSDVYSASSMIHQIEVLKEKLKQTQNKQERYAIKGKIDELIIALNSRNRRLAKLSKKNGSIEPHQRSLSMKSSDIIEERNREVLDEGVNPQEFYDKLDNLTTAYKKLHRAKKKNNPEMLKIAKAEVRKAEKAVYGRKFKGHEGEIKEALDQRKKLIEDVQNAPVIDNDRKYQREVRRTARALKKLDRRIMGRKNVKLLGYDHLKTKMGILFGGTAVMLPSPIENLNDRLML